MIDLIDTSKYILSFVSSQKNDNLVIGVSLSFLSVSVALVAGKTLFRKREKVEETLKFKARLIETYKSHNPFFDRSLLETLLSLGRLAGGKLPNESHYTSNFNHLTSLLMTPSLIETIPSRLAALSLNLSELKTIPATLPREHEAKKETVLMSAKSTKQILIDLLSLNVTTIYTFIFNQLRDESLRPSQEVPQLMKLLKGILEFWNFRDRFRYQLEEHFRLSGFLKEINQVIHELEPVATCEEVVEISQQVRESVSSSLPPHVEPQMVPLLQTSLAVDAIFSHTLAVALPELSNVFDQFLSNIAACKNEQERKAAIEDYRKLSHLMLDARVTFATTMCKARQECVQTHHEMVMEQHQNVFSLMNAMKQIEGPQHASV